MAKRPKKLAIKWTGTAQKQFYLALDYLVERNKSTTFSEKLTEIVWDKIDFISRNPLASKATSHPDTRISSMGHYSIVYKIVKNEIIIMAFWDNRQDPKKLYELLGGN